MSEAIKPHILVTDDDPQIRALLQEYLAENGLRVSVACNGAEMSGILSEEAVDLIVLDLRLLARYATSHRFRSSCSPACATKLIGSWDWSLAPTITSPSRSVPANYWRAFVRCCGGRRGRQLHPPRKPKSTGTVSSPSWLIF